MSKRAYITSPDSLQDLSSALQRFISEYQSIIEDLNINLNHKMMVFQDLYHERRRSVDHWQDMYDDAQDEDEKHYALRRLVEAQEQFQAIKRELSIFEGYQEYYKQQASRVHGDLTVVGFNACAFLERKYAQLQDYLSLKIATVEIPTNSISNLASVPLLTNHAARPDERSDGNITDSPLPEGFEWVPLTTIDAAEISQLPDETDFKKVSPSAVKTGLAMLKDVILPAFKQSSALDSSYFSNLDEHNKDSDQVKLQTVYEAFFGLDHIYLDGRKDTKQLSITNGRHRIKIALELGWQYIPAKVARTL